MQLSRKYRLNLLASGIVATVVAAFAFAPAAHAQQVTRFTTYMHSGPGLQYSVTDEIPNRTAFTTRKTCNGGWCQVVFGGVVGYIQQNTLISGAIHG